MIETIHGPLALGHNGNLINSTGLRQRLLEDGVGLSSSSDTEVMTMMLARAQGRTWNERIRACMKEWVGAYSLVILTTRLCLCGPRPMGIPSAVRGSSAKRWICRGFGNGRIAHPGMRSHPRSETWRGGDLIGSCTEGACRHFHRIEPTATCVFENIYFARPDHVWDGTNVHHVRQRLGEGTGAK